MKRPLDLTDLVVDSFDVSQTPGFTLGVQPLANNEEARTRYCSYYATCETCFTDCPCA